MTFLAAEHFVKAPEWTWLILAYFFFAGLAGGCYALGALLRLTGRPGDENASRVAFLLWISKRSNGSSSSCFDFQER